MSTAVVNPGLLLLDAHLKFSITGMLTDIERQRAANIAKNNEELQKLGIAHPWPISTGPSSRRQQQRRASPTQVLPTRAPSVRPAAERARQAVRAEAEQRASSPMTSDRPRRVHTRRAPGGAGVMLVAHGGHSSGRADGRAGGQGLDALASVASAAASEGEAEALSAPAGTPLEACQSPLDRGMHSLLRSRTHKCTPDPASCHHYQQDCQLTPRLPPTTTSSAGAHHQVIWQPPDRHAPALCRQAGMGEAHLDR